MVTRCPLKKKKKKRKKKENTSVFANSATQIKDLYCCGSMCLDTGQRKTGVGGRVGCRCLTMESWLITGWRKCVLYRKEGGVGWEEAAWKQGDAYKCSLTGAERWESWHTQVYSCFMLVPSSAARQHSALHSGRCFEDTVFFEAPNPPCGRRDLFVKSPSTLER